jgi:hypothetical protein
MKKLFTILTLAASIFAISNVSAATIESDNTQHTISLSIVQDNPNRELLETAVKEMQKMLPMDIGMGMTMSDAYVTSSNLALEIEASSELIDMLREGFKNVEKSDILASVTADDSTRVMLQFCIAADCGFTLTYTDSSHMNQITITFTPEDLAAILQ